MGERNAFSSLSTTMKETCFLELECSNEILGDIACLHLNSVDLSKCFCLKNVENGIMV